MSPSSRRRSLLLAALATVPAMALTATGAAAAPADARPAATLARSALAAPVPALPPALAALDGHQMTFVSNPVRTPVTVADAPGTSFVGEVQRTMAPAVGGARAGLQLAPQPLSNWEVTYIGGWPDEARAAYQRAVDTWSRVISSSQPIRVDAIWERLDNPGVLGQTGPSGGFYDSTKRPNERAIVWPIALLEASKGDLNAGAADIIAEFNSAPGAPWHFASTAPTAGEVDFQSVALHELGHGLGIFGTASKSGTQGGYGDVLDGTDLGNGKHPWVYDAITATPSSYVVDYPSPSVALGSALTGNQLTWAGTLGIAGAGGVEPKLYAPSTWQPGSSFSHLDESTYPAGNPNSLMTPVLRTGEAVRDPGDIALGMLYDMGWPAYQVRKYVDALYHDFLGRAAEPAGLSGWSNALVAGTLSRYQVALSLATSTEYLNTVVAGYYRDVLGREPDGVGLAGWVRAIQGGTPIAVIGAAFYASQESYDKAQRDVAGSATADQKWVESLYRALLGRSADPGGLAGWVSQTQTRGRLFVSTALYGSQETLVHRVTVLYRALLGRDPDPSGLQAWPAVVSRNGDLSLAATLATSVEYYDRAQLR